MSRLTICDCGKFIELYTVCQCKKQTRTKTKQVNGDSDFIKVKNLVVIPRDEGLCQRCRIKFDKITDAEECHHVFNQQEYKHLAKDPDNLIMLCRQCHKIFSTNRWKDKLDFEWPLWETLQAKRYKASDSSRDDMFIL